MSTITRTVTACMGMLAILLLAACQTSGDPHEGGFLGGVHGLSSGVYEARIQEREERLNRLKDMQGELETQRSDLESRQQQSMSAYQMEQQRVADLSREAQALGARLKALKTEHQEQERTRKELIIRLEDLQGDIDHLAVQAESSLHVEVMANERNALEEEYRLLLDIYRAISQ